MSVNKKVDTALFPAMEKICDLEEGIIVSGGAVPSLDFYFSNRCVKGKSMEDIERKSLVADKGLFFTD